MQPSDRRLAVLFLESEEDLCLAVERLLAASREDIDPIFVSDGNQAMEVIRRLHSERRHLDVFVTDYAHPPGPDATELIRWIRNFPEDFRMRGGLRIKDLPIVVLSGNRFAGKVESVASNVRLLWKPFKFRDLLDSVDAMHASH